MAASPDKKRRVGAAATILRADDDAGTLRYGQRIKAGGRGGGGGEERRL